MGDVEINQWLIGNNRTPNVHLAILVDIVGLNVLEERAVHDVVGADCSDANAGEVDHPCEFGPRDTVDVA